MFNLGKKIASSMAAFGLCGGLAFLAGCCDDCEEHHHACDTCDQPRCTACGDEVSAPVSYSSTVSEEPISTSYVRESEPAPAPAAVQPAPVSQGPSLREVEIRNKRDRLLEIDREKILYPDRIAQLNDEAARIDRDLRAIEADMNAKGELSSPANTIESSNIQVQDRSNLGKPVEPLPAETAKPAPLPDASAPAVAPSPEPAVEPAPIPEPAVVAPPAPEQPAPQAAPLPDSTPKDADVRSDSKKMSDSELEALCQQIERDMDAQKKALENKPADAPSTENQAYPEGD
jgi:hypothetical protein